MTEKVIYTPLGILELIAADNSLVYCNWRHPDCQYKKHKIISLFQGESGITEEIILQDAMIQLEAYFARERDFFGLPLVVSGSEFQMRVWKAITGIAYGETATYGDIARQIGIDGGVRAVASACGMNPLALIIPCHRIVSKAGIGGYTGGVEKKKRLLWMEKSQKILQGK